LQLAHGFLNKIQAYQKRQILPKNLGVVQNFHHKNLAKKSQFFYNFLNWDFRMSGFVTMPPQAGTCRCCQGSLDDGSPLLGHEDVVDHVFHAHCLMRIIDENPHGQLKCPLNCNFVATRIDGNSIPIHLKQIGRRASLQSERWASEVILAAKELNGSRLQFLLKQAQHLQPKDCGEALVSAAESGDDGLIIDMLLQYGPVSSIYRGRAAIAAMSRYRLNGFCRILEEGGNMDDYFFSSALRQGAQNNQIDFLRALMGSGQPINEAALGDALLIALKSRSFDSVHELLPEGVRVPGKDIKRLVILATELNRQDLLELFCRQPISVDIWRTAIRTAEAAGLGELTRWLRTKIC
jgi:hypothetical protein